MVSVRSGGGSFSRNQQLVYAIKSKMLVKTV
jgi:hypothetical protein